jgi:hypothetical protein
MTTVRVPYTPNQLATVVFTVSILLIMLCVPASREWMADKGQQTIVYTLRAVGFDLTPLT